MQITHVHMLLFNIIFACTLHKMCVAHNSARNVSKIQDPHTWRLEFENPDRGWQAFFMEVRYMYLLSCVIVAVSSLLGI